MVDESIIAWVSSGYFKYGVLRTLVFSSFSVLGSGELFLPFWLFFFYLGLLIVTSWAPLIFCQGVQGNVRLHGFVDGGIGGGTGDGTGGGVTGRDTLEASKSMSSKEC